MYLWYQPSLICLLRLYFSVLLTVLHANQTNVTDQTGPLSRHRSSSLMGNTGCDMAAAYTTSAFPLQHL